MFVTEPLDASSSQRQPASDLRWPAGELGLLLGRKDLIDAARFNNSPNSNVVGRGLKVAKEDIIGVDPAADWVLETGRRHKTREAEFRKRADRIVERVKKAPTVEPTQSATHS